MRPSRRGVMSFLIKPKVPGVKAGHFGSTSESIGLYYANARRGPTVCSGLARAYLELQEAPGHGVGVVRIVRWPRTEVRVTSKCTSRQQIRRLQRNRRGTDARYAISRVLSLSRRNCGFDRCSICLTSSDSALARYSAEGDDDD